MPTSSSAALWRVWVLGCITQLGININISSCPGLVYTCQYNPNITNIIIFWQIHLEMSRGRRIFINDITHTWPGLITPSQWTGQPSSRVRVVGRNSERLLWGSDRSLYKKRSWAGKYFIQSQTACNLIIVWVILVSRLEIVVASQNRNRNLALLPKLSS